MELNKLRYFVEVCRYGNMSRAADALFISQQNVSKAIAALETELDTTLFLRSGGSLVITPDGEYLLQKANWILAEASVIDSHFKARSSRGQTMHVAGVQGLLYRCGKKTQRLLLGSGGPFNVSFLQRPPHRLESDVLTGNIRFGLTLAHEDMSARFDVTPLTALRPQFIVSSRHPLAKHETVTAYQMAQYPMIAPDMGSAGGWNLDRFFRGKGLRPYIVLSSNEAAEVMELVRNSDDIIGGISAVDMEKNLTRGLARLTVSEPLEDAKVVLITRRDEPFTRQEKAFRDALKASFAGEKG